MFLNYNRLNHSQCKYVLNMAMVKGASISYLRSFLALKCLTQNRIAFLNN